MLTRPPLLVGRAWPEKARRPSLIRHAHGNTRTRQARTSLAANIGALLLLACTWPALLPVVRAQSLQPQPHPNHFIVLVDASGSTGDNAAKRAVFEKALNDRLIPGLYRNGFGAVVPPLDPQQDALTLHHFGVVTGDAVTAYTRLKEYDLSSDFIHTIRLRQGRIEAAALRELLPPSQTYNYTILAWAKQLALLRSNPTNPDEVSHRTFMIVVHDGLSNEGSPEGEAEAVRRHSPDNFRKVKPMVTAVDREYIFSDGQGHPGPAWADEVRGATGSVFVEAYEVLSAADAAWTAEGLRLRPFEDLQLRWDEESGARPSGILSSELSDEFKKWMSEAAAADVSFGARADGEVTTGSASEVPVVFRGPLACEARPFEGTLRVTLRRADPLLGVRWLEYEHAQGVSAPFPQSCTAAFYVKLVITVLLCLAAAALLAYYFYFRLRGSHLLIEIPGTLRPLRLPRRGRLDGTAPVLPQSGLEALSLKLPGQFRQSLFYRKASVTLSAEGAGESPLAWAAADGPTHVDLPLAGGSVPAHWRQLPAAPITIKVSFRQGRQSSEVRLAYPRALTEDIRSTRMSESNENRVYVALDLGSESMAAYYEDTRGNGGMIKLQSLAGKLHADGSGNGSTAHLRLLKEAQAGGVEKDSPRLWNRISLKAQTDLREPDDSHATLHFIHPAVRASNGKYENVVSLEAYKKSLFQFFHTQNAWPPEPAGGYVLPNPKILFQQQITDLLARIPVRNKTGELVRLRPEVLIQHLTLQVLVNFVLHSPELSGYRREDIHLTITVPNVYSLPHAESIKEFVRRHEPDLYDVQVLSESDAVAYYALKGVDQENDPPELQRFKLGLQEELRKSRAASIITLDVGKGTTDLSWVVVQKPRPADAALFGLLGRKAATDADEQRRHSVQGKTGKSSGGNYLSYLIACHYEACLKEAARKRPLPKGQMFSFIRELPDSIYHYPQVRTAADLDQLIELVKRGMTEDYGVDDSVISLSEQRRRLDEIVGDVFDVLQPGWELSDEATVAAYTAFRDEAINLMLLPPVLDQPRRPSLIRRLVTLPFTLLLRRARHGPEPEPALTDGDDPIPVAPTPQTAELKRQLEKYVRENVDDMLDSLRGLVDEHQAVKGRRGDVGSSLVVVSGQASQFKPLRKAVRTKCREMGIGEEQILMMEGVASKEACCKGVVNFWSAEMLHTNPKELHGTYGCIDANLDEFKPFDMRKLKIGQNDIINFGEKGRYYVVFTPRSYQEVLERPPRRNDGATALIGVFSGVSSFEIEYIPEELELRVNKRTLTISSFGNVDGSIYKKVWPEILEPYKD